MRLTIMIVQEEDDGVPTGEPVQFVRLFKSGRKTAKGTAQKIKQNFEV